MLPYTDQVILPLKALFAQDDFSVIPSINLKPNSNFSLITSNVSSLAITTDASKTEAEQITDIFDSISAYIKDDRNILRLESLEHLSKNFAATLENSYTTLNSLISPTIDDISSNIKQRYTELMVREKAESLLPDDVDPSESDYVFIDWKGLLTPINQNEIIDAACNNANLNIDELSLLNLGYIVEKLNFGKEFVAIDFPEETITSLTDKLNALLVKDNSTVTVEQIQQLIKMVTNLQSYNSFCAKAYMTVKDTQNIAANCLSQLQDINAFVKICQTLPMVFGVDISADASKTITSNIKTLMKTIYAIQYWLIFCKEKRFAGKLILDKKIINGPVYKEFIADGHSIKTIHDYLKAFYMSTELPTDGISVSIVSSASIAEHLARSEAKMASNAIFIKSKCLVSAYEYGIRKFMKDPAFKELNTTNHPDPGLFLTMAMRKATYLGGDIAHIDKVLYDLIIASFFKDSLVAKLYKYLGTSFDNLIDTTDDDITDLSIITAQCSGITELLIDYLFDTLVDTESN